MRMKLRLLCFLFSLMPFIAFAQPRGFTGNTGKFVNEMDAYFRETKADEESRKALNAFEKVYNSLDSIQQSTIVKTANKMADRKMKADAEYRDYLNTIVDVFATKNANDNFIAVHVVMEKLLNKRNRQASTFLNFSSTFFEGQKLFISKSQQWSIASDDYVLKMDSVPRIEFLSKVDLVGEARGDRSVIYGTRGTYYPLSNRWVAKGGIVNWSRAGLDTLLVYAQLKYYRVDCSKADFSADSVSFFHTKLFKTALIGRLEDRLSTNNDADNATYPKFDSYERKYEIKNFFPNVDYKGGFSMAGSKLYGIGTDNERASITIYANNQLALRTFSNAYILQADEVIAFPTEVTIYIQQDSIYHPGTEFRFNATKRQLVLLRRDEGIGNAAYFDSYHQMSFEVERMQWDIDKPNIEMGMIKGQFQRESFFESKNFYKEEKFRRVAGIQDVNPLTILKRLSLREGSTTISITSYAKEVKLREQDVIGLLRQMVEWGFISLDEKAGVLRIKEKTFNYISNEAGNLDYDVIRFGSLAEGSINANFNINTKDLEIRGVEQIFLSDSQNVRITPYQGKVTIQKNRDMVFGGLINAGTLDFYGPNFNFSYDGFSIDMPQIDSLKIKVLGKENSAGFRELLSLKTVLRDLKGQLYIDQPDNKSGRKLYPRYPYFQTNNQSYVYYDYPYIQNSVYRRSDFWFRIDPFIIDSLDDLSSTSGLAFPGLMHSGGIFPDFEQTLSYQPDTSLGFVTRTPQDGYVMYKGKGRYYNIIRLSDKGFYGEGSIVYGASRSESDKYLFLLDSTNAPLRNFNLQERGAHPQAISNNGYLHWEPYEDSMFVKSLQTPTILYADLSRFNGTICYTNRDLTGNGWSSIEGADLFSRRFLFEPTQFTAAQSIARIFAIDTSKVAIEANNVKSKIDFTARRGDFESLDPNQFIRFEYNLYSTNLPVFTWLFDERKMNFEKKSGDAQNYSFVSIHPAQDSLYFESGSAVYDLVKEDIKVDGVPKIEVADAEIKPYNQHVEIYGQAIIQRLEQAELIANTTNRYHRLYDAYVDIFGRKKYAANAYYDYKSKQTGILQKIHFEEIRVDTNYTTFAKGIIEDTSNFLLNAKVRYKGDVYLKASNRFLDYDGFVKINHNSQYIQSQFFRYKGFVNPDTVALTLNDPRDENKMRLYTGMHLGITAFEGYGTFVSKKIEPNDVDVINVEGKLVYDEKRKIFKVGTDGKLFSSALKGNLMEFDDTKELLYAEGPLNLGVDFGSKLTLTAAGAASNYAAEGRLLLDAVILLDFEFLPEATSLLLKSIEENAFDAQGDKKDRAVFEKAIHELIPQKEASKLLDDLRLSGIYKLPKSLEKGFVISGANLEWDQGKRAWRDTNGKIGIMSIYDKQVNKEFNGHLEVVRKRSGNIVNIYIEVGPSEWYFYTYRQGQMEAISSDDNFNKVLTEKTKARSPYSISAMKRKLDFVRSYNE